MVDLLDDNSSWSRISLELGVNRERIKQVERNAIRKANAALTLLERKVLCAHYGMPLNIG